MARWLIGVGIPATLAANVVHGLGRGPSGTVAAWPAATLVGSYELLIVIIRSTQAPAGPAPGPGASGAPADDPFQAQAAEAFAGEVRGRAGSFLAGDPRPVARRATAGTASPRVPVALSNAKRRRNAAPGQADAATGAGSR